MQAKRIRSGLLASHCLAVILGLLFMPPQPYAQQATFSDKILHLPLVAVGDDQYTVSLEQVLSEQQILFQLREAEPAAPTISDDPSTYSDSYLSVPSYQAASDNYWAQLKLVNEEPIQFALVSGGPLSPEPYDCSSPLIDPINNSTTAQLQQSGAWKTAVPEQVGVDSQLLAIITSQLNDGTYTGIDSVLAVKCGFLIYEQYFNGYHSNAVHDLRSTTKSITSGLVGIAIDKGFIENVDLPVAQFLADYPQVEFWTDSQQEMTIEDLLTMRSGQDCNDSETRSPGNEQFMYPRYNWIQFFTELPALHPPGTVYSYCTAGVVALGGVLDSATGLRTDFFAQKYLFDELQISNYHWEYMPSGHVDTGGHIHMTPRDMAKFGQLYLQRGRWASKQLISEQWIERTNGQQVVLNEDWYYGYLWRERTFEISEVPVTYFYTQGNGGQFIYVVPELDMVIVLTGSNYNQSAIQVFNIKNDIIAADL